MSRNTFGISISQLERAAAHGRAIQSYQDRARLIDSQTGLSDEPVSTCYLKTLDFNEETRIAHIVFEEITKYRTIDRYVTQNRVRYPIYSGLKTKTKIIKKTVKMTNDVLEHLQTYGDELISKFAHEILSFINNADFYPSWYIYDTLQYNQEQEIKTTKENYETRIANLQDTIASCNNNIGKQKAAMGDLMANLSKLKATKKKKEKALNDAQRVHHKILFSIITFGLYLALHSDRIIEKRKREQDAIDQRIISMLQQIEQTQKELQDSENQIALSKNQIEKLEADEERNISEIADRYSAMFEQIEPLPLTVSTFSDEGFIPLKQLVAMKYEKIIGCYVIHNVEKNKYYVGQSKDVMRRVCKQHFDGTRVKNIIFAEDYYSSTYENKQDLFEVRIIPLETKDELDRAEASLIELYDSFNNGYNGTNGNS